jgi:hypothetical protein
MFLFVDTVALVTREIKIWFDADMENFIKVRNYLSLGKGFVVRDSWLTGVDIESLEC